MGCFSCGKTRCSRVPDYTVLHFKTYIFEGTCGKCYQIWDAGVEYQRGEASDDEVFAEKDKTSSRNAKITLK